MPATVRIWDPFVRIFHWSLVASFAVAWLTAGELKNVHEVAGYAAGALVAFRLVWGLIGSRYARFTQFIRSPGRTIGYASDVLARREARYLGHNPLGAVMIVWLLLAMSVVAITGWLQTTDAFWGIEWVQETHDISANLMLILVALHVFGVIFSSVRHGENLVRAMLTGRKAAAQTGDVS